MSALLLMWSRACHWQFVPSGCSVTASTCLTATAVVGVCSAVKVCLLGEGDMGTFRGAQGL